VEQGLEGLSFLFPGEGVGGQDRRHHERDDQEQGSDHVAEDQDDQPFIGRGRHDRLGDALGEHVDEGADVEGAFPGGKPDGGGEHHQQQGRQEQHGQHERP